MAANPIASAEWDRVVWLLVEQRVITSAFRAALEAYVLSYADVVGGEMVKAQPGYTPVVTDGDSLKPHPIVKIVNSAKVELRQWAGVLGLLPTTVGKVQAVPMPEAVDEDDALLARMERRFDVVNGGKE